MMHLSYIISNFQKNKDIFNPFNIFAIVFSGLCHDVGHRGFTNDFEVASKSDLALRYHDRSVIPL